MTPRWIWLLLGALSLLWAGVMWAGYQLFAVMVGTMPAATHWLADVPALQQLWESAIKLLGGLDGAVQILTWTLWGIGQAALLGLAWVAVKYLPAHALERLRARLMQRRTQQRW